MSKKKKKSNKGSKKSEEEQPFRHQESKGGSSKHDKHHGGQGHHENQKGKKDHNRNDRESHSGFEGESHQVRYKSGSNDAIQLIKDNQLAKPDRAFTLGLLEEALLREFPAEDACDWDRTGISVGERGVAVRKVAVALDVTVSAIEQAARNGADVLITHHPAFLESPESFAPAASVAVEPGALVWAAIRNKVALMNFHTALDVSPAAQAVLPSMLGLSYTGRLIEPTDSSGNKGFGQICKTEGRSETLRQLAARATSVFGRLPRVWGNYDKKVDSIVTATGSAGDLGRACLNEGIDCLICGEVKYHEALALADAGLLIIELGHDVSELPLVAVLAEVLTKVGLHRDDIVIIDQSKHWSTPEAIRV